MRISVLLLLLMLGISTISSAKTSPQGEERYRALMTKASNNQSTYQAMLKKSLDLDNRIYEDLQSNDKKYRWKLAQVHGALISIDNSNPHEVVFRVSINESKQYDVLGLSVASSDVRVGDQVTVLGFITPGLLPGRDRHGKLALLPMLVCARLLSTVNQPKAMPPIAARPHRAKEPEQVTDQEAEPPQPTASPSLSESKGHMVCTPRRTGGEQCQYVAGSAEQSRGAGD